MSRDKDTEQGKANHATVRRIIRQRAEIEQVRVIFTRDERYWAIREQLHHMTPNEVASLADSIADGGEQDPRAWDQELADAIGAHRGNRSVPARLYGCKPVAIRLWKDPAPSPAVLAIEEQARTLLVGEGLKEAAEGQAGFRFRTDYRAVCVRGILPEGTDWPLFTEEIQLRLERSGWSTESADGFGVKVSPPAEELPAHAPAPDVDPYEALYASLSAADMTGAMYDVTASQNGTERHCPQQDGKRMALAVAIRHGDGARVQGTAELFTVDWHGVKNGPGDVVFTFRRRTATVAQAQGVGAAVKASGLTLGDLVEVSGRKVETEKGWDYVPAWYGHLRDVWISDGQVVARVDGQEGEPGAPLLSDLRPVRWHMRTVNGGTPERIPTLDALREINNAMTAPGRDGVREMSAAAGTAGIVYWDVRGEVWLRPATSAEIAMEQKPERERYAEGDRVIVRGTYYRHETRRTYVLDEYEGTVTNWVAGHFNVRAVDPDEDGTTYGVRPCAVSELRPAPPTVDDVVDVPHDLYLSGELRHQGVTAERVRKIVRNLRGKRAVFVQDPGDLAIVVQNTRYVPQRPAGAPEPAGEPQPQVWSERDREHARGFAAKFRAETVCAEPSVAAEPTDEALTACFQHTVRPIRAELYPLVREELAGWDARIVAEDAARPENVPAVSPAPLFTALAAYEATNDIGMNATPEDLERLARHLLSLAPGAPSPERRALVAAHYALEAAAESLTAAAERRGKPGQLPIVKAASQQADAAIGAAREAILGVQPHARRIRGTDMPTTADAVRAAARAYLTVTGTPEELAAVESGTPTVQVWCSSDKQSGWTVTAHMAAGVCAELDGRPVHIPAHPPILVTFRKRDGRVGADVNARKELGSRLRFSIPVEYVEDRRV
ncbi:hypothetical protein AB0N79_38750 [Streptomyces microflavus]|uniref:hypothetical protein n=1 Tax=Streptomyces microflavus TaxID=1919 RepID=UPI00342353B6